MALKTRKRELDAEKRLFENKVKRAKGREARILRVSSKRRESEASDIDSGPLSKTTSTCSSLSESESSSTSRSVTPVRSTLTTCMTPTVLRSPISPEGISLDQHSLSLSQLGSHNKPIECGFTPDCNDPLMSEQSIPEQPCPQPESQITSESESDSSAPLPSNQAMSVQQSFPLSPSQPGSRINPIECESNSFSSCSPSSEVESSSAKN